MLMDCGISWLFYETPFRFSGGGAFTVSKKLLISAPRSASSFAQYLACSCSHWRFHGWTLTIKLRVPCTVSGTHCGDVVCFGPQYSAYQGVPTLYRGRTWFVCSSFCWFLFTSLALCSWVTWAGEVAQHLLLYVVVVHSVIGLTRKCWVASVCTALEILEEQLSVAVWISSEN